MSDLNVIYMIDEFSGKRFFDLKILSGEDVQFQYTGFTEEEDVLFFDWLKDTILKVYSLGYAKGSDRGWNEGYSDAKEDYNIDG